MTCVVPRSSPRALRTPAKRSLRCARCKHCPRRKYRTAKDLALHILTTHGILHFEGRLLRASGTSHHYPSSDTEDACSVTLVSPDLTDCPEPDVEIPAQSTTRKRRASSRETSESANGTAATRLVAREVAEGGRTLNPEHIRPFWSLKGDDYDATSSIGRDGSSARAPSSESSSSRPLGRSWGHLDLPSEPLASELPQPRERLLHQQCGQPLATTRASFSCQHDSNCMSRRRKQHIQGCFQLDEKRKSSIATRSGFSYPTTGPPYTLGITHSSLKPRFSKFSSKLAEARHCPLLERGNQPDLSLDFLNPLL